jgi:hypothetical protein
MISLIDKMRSYQIANNFKLILVEDDIDLTDNKTLENWAEKVFQDNKDLIKDLNKEQFINYIVYGK